MTRISILAALLFFTSFTVKTLHVGTGQPHSNLLSATRQAQPGDTIFLRTGVYTGGQYIENLQGTADKWIHILNFPNANVIIRGSTEAWHFTDPNYLHISGIIFEQQTGNGVNIDDSGSYDTPAHHILIENCIFRNMNATGNNDLLKLSGVDEFEVRDCEFSNGATGGSGIDMVGCHKGLIHKNRFENLGSTGIQAKGGTRFVRIEANLFKNAGARALNLGGNTGLQFFRPIDAPFEAADLQVYSNIFMGSQAPVAYVGSVRVEVVNNTIYLPSKWIVRILQETVDPNRFVQSGENSFINNIIYFDNNVSTGVNIGTNTRPNTFTFANNLWYNYQSPNSSKPSLPVQESNGIVGQHPNFKDVNTEDFTLLSNSPAIAKGKQMSAPTTDFLGANFKQPRSIGAFESSATTGIQHLSANNALNIFPNPSDGALTIQLTKPIIQKGLLKVMNADGRLVFSKIVNGESKVQLNLEQLPAGNYVIEMVLNGRRMTSSWIKSK